MTLLPLGGVCAACTSDKPSAPAAVVVTVSAPPTTITLPSTTTSQAPPTTIAEPPPTTLSEAPPPSETAPPNETASVWDWQEHFSPFELAPHQLYSNDCGITATRALLRSHGMDASQDELFDDAVAGNFHSGRAPGHGWNGPYKMVDYLQSFGLDAHMQPFSQSNLEADLSEGKPVIVSTERHYFVISGQTESGDLIGGATGEVVGLGPTFSYQQLSHFSSAHRIIVVDNTQPLGESRLPATALT